MKFQIVSDLHSHHDFYPSAPGLVLAGDVGNGVGSIELVNAIAKDFDWVVYVAGNHEHYGTSYGVFSERAKERLASNIHFLENSVVDIDGVRFAGTTLWSEIDSFGARYINDFIAISDFSVERYLSLHFEAVKFLSSVEADVIVTHHLPSFLSVHPRYAGNRGNSAFASGLDHIVSLRNIWVHGHTHDTFDYLLGDCRVICNPRGYGWPGENRWFDAALVVEV